MATVLHFYSSVCWSIFVIRKIVGSFVLGLEKQTSRRQFHLQDLGVLDGPPPRAIRSLVELCATAVRVPAAALFVFDDTASELFLNASIGLKRDTMGLVGLPLTGSIASFVRSENRQTRLKNLQDAPFDTAVEYERFGIQSYLGSIVCGPADEPIGVLAAMHNTPHDWTFREAKLVEDMAFLMSQQIMLKASFATLKIMSAERKDAQI